MKPHRVRMAHNLIVTYGLYKSMEVFRPALCKQADMTRFHSDDYVNFLRLVTPDNMHEYLRQLQRCTFSRAARRRPPRPRWRRSLAASWRGAAYPPDGASLSPPGLRFAVR